MKRSEGRPDFPLRNRELRTHKTPNKQTNKQVTKRTKQFIKNQNKQREQDMKESKCIYLLLKMMAMISFANSSGFLVIPTSMIFRFSSVIVRNSLRSTEPPTPTQTTKMSLSTRKGKTLFSSSGLLTDLLSVMTTRTFLAFGRTCRPSYTTNALCRALARSGLPFSFGSLLTVRIRASLSGKDLEKSITFVVGTEPKTITL